MRRDVRASLCSGEYSGRKPSGIKSVVSVVDSTCSNAAVQADYDSCREMFLESFAETDDALTEKYLEGATFSEEEISGGFKKLFSIGNSSLCYAVRLSGISV
ncbi:MAG: hypothetical protein H7A34_01480 [bacterium]|nr:hypothetical protein [bacterium]